MTPERRELLMSKGREVAEWITKKTLNDVNHWNSMYTKLPLTIDELAFLKSKLRIEVIEIGDEK